MYGGSGEYLVLRVAFDLAQAKQKAAVNFIGTILKGNML
jgi:hypothetical protein